jgi:hypothetical protein
MYSRPPKSSHLDTIAYEIDMLRFCLGRLRQPPANWEPGDRNLFIEAFLLHFRNLVRFFSGQNHRNADLSTAVPMPWAGRELSNDELARLQEPARKLDDEYFSVVSKYLQHCTEVRYSEGREWDVDGMYSELSPLVAYFEQHFLKRQFREVAQDGVVDNSTVTISRR